MEKKNVKIIIGIFIMLLATLIGCYTLLEVIKNDKSKEVITTLNKSISEHQSELDAALEEATEESKFNHDIEADKDKKIAEADAQLSALVEEVQNLNEEVKQYDK